MVWTSISRNIPHRRRPVSSASEVRVRVHGGYHPDTIYWHSGAPLRLVFRREESSTCSEQVVFPAFGKSATLPQGEEVTVVLAPAESGEYEFTCAMGMLHGRLVITPAESEDAEPARPTTKRATGSD